MSSFTNPLIVKVLENGRLFELMKDFVYYRNNDNNVLIKIPKGFKTDFATTPRIIWSLYPPFGKYSKSCVLHDYLCQLWKYKKTLNNILITRKECDIIFLESMIAINVNVITRNVLYCFVRLFAIIKGYK